jgi:hypothetical protein
LRYYGPATISNFAGFVEHARGMRVVSQISILGVKVTCKL